MNNTMRGVAMLAPAAAAAALLLSATAAGAAPYNPDASLSSNTTNPDVGGRLTLSGVNYGANEDVALDLHSQVVRLSTVRADANGSFTTTVRLPANFECEHFVTALGLTTDRSARTDIVIGDCEDDQEVGGVDRGVDRGGDGTDLPATGAAVGGLAAAGALMTAAGIVLVRRRRSSWPTSRAE